MTRASGHGAGRVGAGAPLVDYLVVGSGIIGLATAYQIQKREPDARVAIVEKEEAVGQHQTGHNSGVLHAGLYYRPGSLKARLCREGKVELERYATERCIPFAICGKLVVALTEEEIPGLKALACRGRENGINDVREVSGPELREIEPHARGVAGLYIAETGVIDYGSVARNLAHDIQVSGGEILLRRKVIACEHRRGRVLVETTLGELEARRVICCAGLHSDRIKVRNEATQLTDDERVRIVPFRGDYYTLSKSAADLIRALVYPVPNPSFPFLGVHFTRHVDGEVTAGPSAVVAFAREGYRRTDVNLHDSLNTFLYPGFWRLARKYWRTGLVEQWRDISKSAFVRELNKYIPELSAEDLVFGPTGVRAQALDRGGSLLDDFVLDGDDRILHVRNAPSPGATASLAIGRYLAERASQV